ncbi:hypothetical protein [Deefgea rivuli]|nr:hypothetical protein [Deefgea rivuli]
MIFSQADQRLSLRPSCAPINVNHSLVNHLGKPYFVIPAKAGI